MLTLRRIPKYTPAVVLGLLVVVWTVSLFVSAGFTVNFSGFTLVAFTLPSRIQFMWGSLEEASRWEATFIQPAYSLGWLLGRFDFIADARSPLRSPDEYYSALAVPLPLLVTLILPPRRWPLRFLPLSPLALLGVHGARGHGTRVLLAVAGVSEGEWRHGNENSFRADFFLHGGRS